MPDLDKLFEKAEKNLQKQKFESALETYLEIYKYEPNDEEVLVNLGDLSLKLKRTAEGLWFQSQLADFYVKRSDTAKAVATCRKILKQFPKDVSTISKLASLLEKSRKNVEALEAYRNALEIHRKSSAIQPAIDCLQRIVVLDPDSMEAYVELAELAVKAQRIQVATPAFLKAGELALARGREDRWAELIEKAHSLDPGNEAARIGVAEVYLKKDRPAEVGPLLELLTQGKPEDLTIGELLVRAYLATGQYEKAEPLCWKLYQARPEAFDLAVKLAEGLIRTGGTQKALTLLGKMKEQFLKKAKRNEFLKVMEKLYEVDESNLLLLEALSALYDEMNKDDGLRRSLTRMFNLYLASEQYPKAADTLEKIVDVDPYGQGHQDRLLNLEGHIDPAWYNNLVARLQPPSAARTSPASNERIAADAAPKAAALDDLVIEGEMYYQYQLAAKLTETLEKIDSLFPGAQERHKRLRDLYDAAGFVPTPSPASGSAGVTAAGEAGRTGGGSPRSLDDLKRISEITAHIHRESTPQGVLQVAVSEVGRVLNTTRCWGALGSPDRSSVLTVEYCSPSASPSDAAAALKAYETLFGQAGTNPDGWLIQDVTKSQVLAPALAEVQRLGIKSLLALPLMDQEEPAGLLLLQQCDGPRAWTGSESLMLKAIATQVVIAINNTKLRRLVRSLAGSDDETGLLPRSSYLDCLLAESGRAKELAQPVSVCLLEPDNPATLAKTLGEAGMQRYYQQVTKVLLANLRQSDTAIRYSPYSIAVIFPDTALPQCGAAVEKLRQALSQIRVDGMATSAFCASVCDLQLGPNFDLVDGVTEVINRLESALEKAHKEGGHRVYLSKFQV